MTYFNGTELRALVLATGLLLLGAAVRLGCGPSPDDFSWKESGALTPGPPGVSLLPADRLPMGWTGRSWPLCRWARTSRSTPTRPALQNCVVSPGSAPRERKRS